MLYQFAITDNGGILDDRAAIVVKYTSAAGDGSVFTPPTVDITAPYSGGTPVPSAGGKYDGTYDLTYQFAAPGGVSGQTLAGYLIIRNGVVSARDGAFNGTVDATFGSIKFTSICPYNNSQATWTGIMDASARSGANFGQGKYACTNPGDSFSWSARQSGQ